MPAECSVFTIDLNSHDLVAEPPRGVAHVGREEADRVVAPVVRQPALGELPIDGEVMHRQQLDAP